jgi:5'-deoxynucleotidase YfbR-like HD superfamily hydrolase
VNRKIAVYLYTLREVKRFNKFRHPSKRRQNYATHGFNTLAISSVISHKYNLNHPNQPVDLERMYGKIIFGSLHPTFFGDVPKSIQDQYPDLAEAFKLAKQANGEKLILDFSEIYREQFTNYIVNTKDDTAEGEIVKQSENFSVLMKCEEELQSVSNKYFKKLKNMIKDKLVNGETLNILNDLPSDILEELADESYDEYHHKSFLDIYFDTIKSIVNSNLPEIQWYFKEVYFTPYTKVIDTFQEVLRWNNIRCTEDTDSEHSFYVAMWCFILGLIQRVEYKEEVNIGSMVSKAIFHDIHESITSDILSYVKRINSHVKSLIDKMENDKNYVILGLLPEELQPIFEEYICNAKSDNIEGHLVHISDKVDSMIKSLKEMKRQQSSYFHDTYDKDMRFLMSEANEYHSIKDFCTFMLHEFHIAKE